MLRDGVNSKLQAQSFSEHMSKRNQEKQRTQAGDRVQTELPPGVKLLRVLKGHQATVRRLAFDPQGDTLASGSYDRTVKLWEARSGNLLRTLKEGSITSLAIAPQGRTLASASNDQTV